MMDLSLSELERLEAAFGSPLYLFDETAFTQNYHELDAALKKQYPKYQISYSYKTNYAPYICSAVKRLNGYAEVVSGMEYEIARRVGYPSDQIIFNGPNKGEDGLSALLEGSIVNVDNLDELSAVCERVKDFPEKSFEIGLRVNMDLGQSFTSRFGMDERDIAKAFDLVKEARNLSVAGLHCHISRCRGIQAWQKRTEIMLGLADRFFAERPPKYLDLGSGMFGKMDPVFEAQFDHVPSYTDYAFVTAKLVADRYAAVPEADKPILFTEPGTTLVNKYIDFIGRVDAVKTVRGKSFAVLNCSEHNLGETCTLKRLPIKILHAGRQTKTYEGLAFVGYTCLEQDVMYTDYCGALAVGDYVQFGNVGGYSNVYKPPFIWPNCAMVARRSSGEYTVIKRRETYEDLLQTYSFHE